MRTGGSASSPNWRSSAQPTTARANLATSIAELREIAYGDDILAEDAGVTGCTPK
jgi:hypothetical protein